MSLREECCLSRLVGGDCLPTAFLLPPKQEYPDRNWRFQTGSSFRFTSTVAMNLINLYAAGSTTSSSGLFIVHLFTFLIPASLSTRWRTEPLLLQSPGERRLVVAI